LRIFFLKRFERLERLERLEQVFFSSVSFPQQAVKKRWGDEQRNTRGERETEGNAEDGGEGARFGF